MRALDLVRHRLADVVQERGALGRLHARSELRRHHAAEVHDLERVLEDVLSVARPEAEPPEDLHQLFVELAAVGLEHRLLAGLEDVILHLGLRLVVHLLDPSRMDAPVLDQLDERHLRGLAADAVEGREHDRLRRVVDDEVDAGEVLERADVATLAADDPPLHVVGRELDERDRGLGRVRRCDSLQRVGDEVPRAPLRLRPRLLLHLAHVARELVPDEIRGALEQVLLRLDDGHPGDPLEVAELALLRFLQLLVEHLRRLLAVGETLFTTLELGRLARELFLAGLDALVGARDQAAALLHLGLDSGAELHRLLARLDARLAAHRLRLALGVFEQLLARPQRLVEPRRSHRADRDRAHDGACDESDQHSECDVHAQLLRLAPAVGVPNLVEPKPRRRRRGDVTRLGG